MPETIDILDGSLPEWAIAEIFGGHIASGEKDIITRIMSGEQDRKLTIEMRVNGVEVSFVHVIRQLRDELNRRIYEAARELTEERAGELSEKLRKLAELGDQVEAHVKCQMGRIFPEAIREEDYR